MPKPQIAPIAPVPAFDVRRSALIPATYVDERGVSHGDDWPLTSSQNVAGVAADGSRVYIGSTSEQNSAKRLPRVTGSTIEVRDAQGAVQYAIDFGEDGSIKGTGRAAGIRLTPTEALNLSSYLDSLTDQPAVSGAQLDRALDLFRQSGHWQQR